MSSSKKGKNGLNIYKDLTDNDVLLPFKGTDKISDEMIANEIPKWCEPGDPLYEFLVEQIKKKYRNSGVIFCPYLSNFFVKDPKKEENQ